jgi:hypothetical protein
MNEYAYSIVSYGYTKMFSSIFQLMENHFQYLDVMTKAVVIYGHIDLYVAI